MGDSRIIVALDFAAAHQAFDLVDQLDPARCKLKVGKELFTRAGPNLVRRLAEQGYDVFLDLKFHDIPNTVAGACAAAAELGVWMLNVHALGGRAMLEAAREAVDRSERRPRLIAVTVLTSMDAAALAEIGIEASPADTVKRLALLAGNCGLDGVVSSAQEVELIKQHCGEDFLAVTPGIRLPTDDAGDQSRIMTPARAVHIGADYLVIGRPITQADDPMAALARIEQDITNANV